jgi:hypothetical protein
MEQLEVDAQESHRKAHNYTDRSTKMFVLAHKQCRTVRALLRLAQLHIKYPPVFPPNPLSAAKDLGLRVGQAKDILGYVEAAISAEKNAALETSAMGRQTWMIVTDFHLLLSVVSQVEGPSSNNAVLDRRKRNANALTQLAQLVSRLLKTVEQCRATGFMSKKQESALRDAENDIDSILLDLQNSSILNAPDENHLAEIVVWKARVQALGDTVQRVQSGTTEEERRLAYFLMQAASTDRTATRRMRAWRSAGRRRRSR